MGDEVVVKRGPGRPRKDGLPPKSRPPVTEDSIRDLVEKKKKINLPFIESDNTASSSEISIMMRNMLRWYNKPLVKSDDECEERLDEFFSTLAETGELPTVEKMALALGTTRTSLWNWENGMQCSARRTLMIKRAKEILAAMDAELASSGKIPQVLYIFRSKNYFGLKDQTDVVVTPNNPVGAEVPEDELRKRIAGDVVVDAEFTE